MCERYSDRFPLADPYRGSGPQPRHVRWPFGSQAGTQSTEPHQPELNSQIIFKANSRHITQSVNTSVYIYIIKSPNIQSVLKFTSFPHNIVLVMFESGSEQSLYSVFARKNIKYPNSPSPFQSLPIICERTRFMCPYSLSHSGFW